MHAFMYVTNTDYTYIYMYKLDCCSTIYSLHVIEIRWRMRLKTYSAVLLGRVLSLFRWSDCGECCRLKTVSIQWSWEAETAIHTRIRFRAL